MHEDHQLVVEPTSDRLVWIDMEMTGLNPNTDRIIEVALVITDSNLNVIAQPPVLVIHQPDEILNAMDEWNTTTHTRTGLIEKVKASTLTEEEAEQTLLAFLKTYVIERSSPLCGNTVGQDRRFMERYMPILEAYVHYRNVDTSTLKELAKRWHPSVYRSFEKKGRHEALADILESIDELKHYRENFLVLPSC